MTLIYAPEEDSYLLSGVLEKEIPLLLKKNPSLRVLEIGVGSGIQLKTLNSVGVKKENLLGVDINPEAVDHCIKNGFNVLLSDLFENVKGIFDVIIFNSPYLPEDEREDSESKSITTGGKKGSEIINLFLKQAKNHIKERGRVYLVMSSLTKDINYLDYGLEVIGRKKLFFEEILVVRIRIKAANQIKT